MRDSWSSAAAQLLATRAANEQLAADTQQTATAQREAEAAASARAATEFTRLIDEVAPEFEAFLAQWGEGAQNLLAATSKGRPFVTFGTEQDSSREYVSVCFTQKGIERVVGQPGDKPYSVKETSSQGTARQAVEYFARYGAGRNAPEQVRAIVGWFEHQMNQFMQ